MARVRAAMAKALVRWASRWIDASYAAWCRQDRGEVPRWWADLWNFPCRWVNRLAIPVASRLDSWATGEQMAEEGWWG